jgi:hypothetical protein
MALQIDIRANIAETGATQINNVNVSTSMQDPKTLSLEMRTVWNS